MDLELTGKTAIITGGSRGIGKATGREFGLEGMKVALVARGAEALEECARELREETGGDFVTILADTGDLKSVNAMVKEAVEKNFGVTVLDVNITKLHGKKKRYGPRIKQRPDTKKAVVTLKQGDRINLIEGL